MASMDGPLCAMARKDVKRLFFPRGIAPEKQYVRRSDLNRSFDQQAIKQILDCLCHSCKKDLKELGKAHLADSRTVARPSDYTDRVCKAKALFALLMFIEHPMFIIPFIEKDHDDSSSIEHYCKQDTNPADLESVWSEYQRGFSDSSNELAHEFIGAMYKFAPPRLRDGKFSAYSQNTCMPFYNEKKLGSGTFGIVYSFEVCDEYIDKHGIPIARQTRRLARKELKRETPIEFELEKNNLEQVKILEDPHIVQIVKSYRKGTDFNLIFPCAKANLRQCLHEADHNLGKLCTGPLLGQEIWQQMLGLAKALDRILNLDLPEDVRVQIYQASDRQILGYHFDLKPANILVFDSQDGKDNVLKISDFGQAKFRPQAEDSRTTNVGGTEEYAAPESNSTSDPRLNSKYDVWSLGCIFLELATFALKGGHSGVLAFERARGKVTNGNWSNYRYFDEEIENGRRVRLLRPSVGLWTEELFKPEVGATETEEQFLLSLKTLLLGMLEVDVRKRLTSTRVYQDLAKILDKAPILEVVHQPTTPVEVEETGAGIGHRKLGHLDSFFARSVNIGARGFPPARIHVSEVGPRLRLTTLTMSHASTYTDFRANLQIVPKYAFRRGYNTNMADWDFRFVSVNEQEILTCDFDYKCNNFNELRTLQGILTGHDVQRTFELTDFRFKKHASVAKAIKSWTTRPKKAKVPQDVDEGLDQAAIAEDKPPYTLQIWKEHQVPIQAESLQASRTDNQTRTPRLAQPSAHAALCRLVVFKAGKIFVLKIADGHRISKEAIDTRRHLVRFDPVRRHSQSYFVASTIPPPKDNNIDVPGIPLADEQLHKAEHAGRVEVESVELEFHQAKDKMNFEALYNNLKIAWDEEEYLLGIKLRPTK